MTARARAKTLILSWFDKGQPSAELRKRFSRDVDVFFETIAARNDWRECLTTVLDDKGALGFRMTGRDLRVRPSSKGLAVTSVVPGWNFGWSRVLPDPISYDVLSWLGHYARQYIHRSHIAKVLMSVWERNRLVLHPFGSSVLVQRYGAVGPIPSSSRMFAAADSAITEKFGTLSHQRLSASRSGWTSRNTLDPAIHQGIFHFLRARNLVTSGFKMEALAAFDCVLHSLQYMDWSWAAGNPRRDRADLYRALGMSKTSVALAEHVYFLRNQFVAHAGGWRWWDAVEHLEGDLIDKVSNTTLRALRRAADLEHSHRRIDPVPDDWSRWFEENFPIIWSAVWFRQS